MLLVHLEHQRLGLIDVHPPEGEAPQVELIAHLQGGEHVLLHGGGLLVLGNDLPHFPLALVHAPAHVLLVKGLGPDGEIGGVKGQRPVDLEPGDTEGHHHVSHRVGLGEQVGDFLAGADVPVWYAGGLHLLLRPVRKAAALSHRLHDFKGALGGHPLGDQKQHNVVAAADGLADRDALLQNQVPGVAQPHVGAVGEAGQPHQNIKLAGLGLLQHAPDEGGAELRNGGAPGGSQNLVVFIAQHLGGLENGHGVRVVQWNFPGIHPGQVLQHADHGGIIVSQHVQLQEV